MSFYQKTFSHTPLSLEPLRMASMLLVVVLVIAGLAQIRPRLATTNALETVVEAAPVAAVAAAPAPAAAGISPIFTPEVRHWEKQILGWAGEFELDPNLVATIMQIESCGDPTAVSRAGAQGLFQVMPFHFAAGENPLDPDTNARRGLAYFVERLQQTGGDVGRAFAGYNGGHVAAGSSWDSWAAETQLYYQLTTGIYEDVQAGLTDSPTLQGWRTNGGGTYCQLVSDKLGLAP